MSSASQEVSCPALHWPPVEPTRWTRLRGIVWVLAAYGFALVVGTSLTGWFPTVLAADGRLVAIPARAAVRVLVTVACFAALVVINAILGTLVARRRRQRTRA